MQKKILFVFTLIFVLTIVTAFSVYGYPDVGQNGTTLTETVSATPTWEIEYTWTLSKRVMPNTWDLFRGDSGKSAYKLSITKDSGVEQAYISGEICVTNPGSVDTIDLKIVAAVQDGYEPPNEFLTSAPVDVSVHPILFAGETYCYSYKVNIAITGGLYPQPHAGGTYKVTGNTTILNHSGHLEEPFGPDDSTTIVFPSTPLKINDHVLIHDTFLQDPVDASGTTEINYDHTFTCDADEGKKENSAYIEYGDKSTSTPVSASVMVTCNALEVSKTAITTFDRTYKWTIDKTADQTDLTLGIGETKTVNYSVTVVAVPVDDNWAVDGKITVHNPADIPAVIKSVTDLISPDITPDVDCGTVEFPYPLAAGQDLICDYSDALPDHTNRTNTATATLQNYSYDKNKAATPDGTTNFSGTKPVMFSDEPERVYDQCITVTDTLGDELGKVCVGDSLPKKFTYPLTVGPYMTCGKYTVGNTASFITEDTKATGEDTWTVNVNVPCGGCTLTQGYWKTHSKHGPAPYDDTWELVGEKGADESFYTSGKTWYEVLWTAPKKGNAYYILAHQYIAAILNKLNGADTTQVIDLIDEATGLFGDYAPSDQLSSEVRDRFITIAGMLDQFNNGMLGPGHCGDEPGYTGPTPSWVYNMYKGDPVIFIPVVVH